MIIPRIGLIAALLAVGAVPGRAQLSSPANRPWPAGVQKIPAESPPLSPAEAMKTFFMPPGYHLELVASEPLVRDPIAMDWDAAGRLWVVEMPAFVRDLKFPEPNLDPICRIVVLESTRHDGRMDKRTVFADHLVLPRSVKVLDHGVLVAEPPNIWLMHDRDGDLRLHSQELAAANFGRRQGDVEVNANGLTWGLDNWIHTNHADIELRLKNGRFEVRKTLALAEWGQSQDDAGRIYRNSNESNVHVDLVPLHYFARNPNLVRTLGGYHPLRDEDNQENFIVWPVRPNGGTNRAYQFGIDRPDGSIERFTSSCAPLVYRGDRLPAELYGNVFVAEPAANLVGRFVIDDDGRGLRARKPYPKGEFLASTDERFRPVYLSNAPDGTLYIVDMYRGVIQQRIDVTQYLHGYITRHKLEAPIGYGRIYRVMHDTTSRAAEPALGKASARELVETLASPNGWRRDQAQQLLVERGDKSIAPALMTLAADAPEARTRLHALWTLDGIDAIEPAVVTKALADVSREVRAAAIRLAERWIGEAGGPMQAAVLQRIDDPDWAVREQLAASLGALPAAARISAVGSFLERWGDDPVAVDAALTGIRGGEMEVLEQMLAPGKARTRQREPAITMLAATGIRGAQDGVVQELCRRMADGRRPAWQRAALMRGAEIALLGAQMPGYAATRKLIKPGEPCPTCPGGRAGPGGAFYYDHPAPPHLVGLALRLNREPAELSALAGSGDDLGKRAKAILARIGWPGKPGMGAYKPLSAEEQRRYDAGREVYRNICQACHQPDGRGQEKLAANLIGSELALAPASVTVRILLNGKEGSIGLMPPIGAMLSDGQIAEVLTYIRREWGQDGSPLDPAAVKAVRAETAGRIRPWTNDELLALLRTIRAGGQTPVK